MNKKIVKIFLIFIGVFMLLAIVEISLKSVGSAVKDFSEQKQEEKRQEEIYNSDTSVQSRETEKFVSDIYDAISKKQYQVVFNLLEPTYKECFFENDLDNFKNYVENTMFLGNEYRVVNVNQKKNYANVSVGITSGETYKTQTCIVKSIDENTSNIIFGDYTNITKSVETNATSSNVRYDIKYYFELSSQGIFVVKATNLSNSEVSLSFSDVNFETNNGRKSVGEITEKITLKPNESQEIKIFCSKSVYSLNNLSFTEIQSGKTEKVYMLLDEIFGTDEE